MTDVARHRLDKAGSQRKPDRSIGRRSKLSKQQQQRRRRTGPEARSTKRKLRTSWQRALGPCGQNQNRQGEETRKNTLSNNRTRTRGKQRSKVRTNRGRQSDLKVKERARAPGGEHVVMCKKGGWGQKRVYRTPESGDVLVTH